MYIVFLIVAMATLLAAGLAFRAGADRDGAGHAVLVVQTEALARSGMAGLMAELDAERDTILAGGLPHFTDRWALYSTGTERGELVILPWESSGNDFEAAGDRLVVSESAKLDVNAADAEQLTRLFEAAGVSGEASQLASSVVAARDRLATGRFLSLGDIVALGALPADVMWGIGDAADESSRPQRKPLSDLLTVHGYEPVLQETGKYKININAAWDDRMGRRIARRFGQELADLVQQVKQNEDFSITETQLAQFLAGSDNPPDDWDQYIDAFTDSDATTYHGRVDLNRVSSEVLYAVTGFDEDTVSAILAARSELSARQQAGTAWLAELGIVEPGAWAQVTTKLTPRTFAWRARILARILRGGRDDGQPTTVEAERLYEVVIDLSAPRPRLAYVRDITMKQTAGDLINRYGTAADQPDRADEADTLGWNDPVSPSDSGRDERPYDTGSDDAGRDDGASDPPDAAPPDGRTPPTAPQPGGHTPSGRWTRGG